MYDSENDGQEVSKNNSGQNDQTDAIRPTSSTESAAKPVELQVEAVILDCPYCRKKFDRASTQSMPFCSPQCKQIDLGLWLNEVHSVPFESDPGIYSDPD